MRALNRHRTALSVTQSVVSTPLPPIRPFTDTNGRCEWPRCDPTTVTLVDPVPAVFVTSFENETDAMIAASKLSPDVRLVVV